MNKVGIVPPLRLCFIMWLVYTVELHLEIDLGYFGIYPRDIAGLPGIFMGPLLHGNFSHLVSNSVPLIALGISLFFFFPTIATRVFLYAYFFTNILVWVFGRPFYHIGASGFVYALASFLVFYGFFKRNFKSVIISIIVMFFYHEMAHDLINLDDRISWESHLMGVIVGVVCAFILSKSKKSQHNQTH